jgi:hypothetical protein
MSDPAAAIRAAFIARMRTAMVGVAKVYDEVPSTRTWPYLALRAIQTIPRETECSSGSETFIDFDGWSKKLNHAETDAMRAAAREALKTDLVVPGHEVIIQEFEGGQATGDPDPSIARVAMSLRLETEPA